MAFTPRGNPYTQAITGGMLWDRREKRLDRELEAEKIAYTRNVAIDKAAAKAAEDARNAHKNTLGTVAAVEKRFINVVAHKQHVAENQEIAKSLLEQQDGLLQKQNMFFNSSTPKGDEILRVLNAALGLGADDNLIDALNTKEAIVKFAPIFASGDNSKIAGWLGANIPARNEQNKNTVSVLSSYSKVVKTNREIAETKLKRDGAAFAAGVAENRRADVPKGDEYWANTFNPAVLAHQEKYPLDKDGNEIPLSRRIKAIYKLLKPNQ